jgi:hypothetical protein
MREGLKLISCRRNYPAEVRDGWGVVAGADAEKVRELVFSGGTALAGLILVFLGAVIAAFESYDSTQRRAVYRKYRKRGILALVAFAGSLLAAALALSGYWIACIAVFYGALSLLLFSFVMVLIVAFVAITDIRP